MKQISSRENPSFKALVRLVHQRRERVRSGQTILDGPHLLQVCADQGPRPMRLLLAESGLQNAEVGMLVNHFSDVECLCFSDGLFREIVDLPNPVGIAAVIDIPRPPPAVEFDRVGHGDWVLLDGVQDMGNVGSILRSAAAFGVTDIFLGTGCADPWNPKVLRAAQGGHFSLRIHEGASLDRVITPVASWVQATVVDRGQALHQSDLARPVVWLFGSEGAGVSEQLLQLAGNRVNIPLASTTESLNVAAAAAICLFESQRQKQSFSRGKS